MARSTGVCKAVGYEAAAGKVIFLRESSLEASRAEHGGKLASVSVPAPRFTHCVPPNSWEGTYYQGQPLAAEADLGFAWFLLLFCF